jgi:hypothetical protein
LNAHSEHACWATSKSFVAGTITPQGPLSMTEFRGNRPFMIFCGVLLACFIAFNGFIVTVIAGLPPEKWHPDSAVDAAIASSAVIAALGCFGIIEFVLLVSTIESSSTIVLTDRQITKRTLFTRQTIAWDELDGFWEHDMVEGTRQGTCRLFDRARRRLTIRFWFLPEAEELKRLLAPHLAKLREQKAHDLGALRYYYRLDRVNGAAVLVTIVPMFLAGGLALLLKPGVLPDLSPAAAFLFGLMLTCGSAAFAIAAAEQVSRVLKISEKAIERRRFFLKRVIPFKQIESLILRRKADEHRLDETLTVNGAGQKIKLDARTRDFPSILEYLRRRTGIEPSWVQRASP